MGTTSNEAAGDNTSLEKRVAGYRHPHLVVLTPSGTWYTVDRRSGVSLAELQSTTAVPPRTTLRLLLDACSGLDAAHHIDGEGGPGPYVHGELGPSSIMAGRDGIGRLIAVPTRRLVGAALHDARGYLAPEKLLGDGIDQRADVFSVGVLLWEAIAGRRLFPDGNVDAVVTQLVGGKVPPLVCAPEATWAAALEPIVQRALAVDPAQRWPNVRALAARVDSLTRGHLASSAQVAAAVALHGGAGAPSVPPTGSVPPANSSASSAPPGGGVEPAPSRAPSARSVSPEADRSRRDAPPPGQIAWEHPGSTMRPPPPAGLAAATRGRQAKLVGAALAVSFAIALTSGYLLLFSGAPESTTSVTRAVLVTAQGTAPSAAALELVPAPAAPSPPALTAAPAATIVPPRPPAPAVAAPPVPLPAPVTTSRPPTTSKSPIPAAAPRPVAPAPVPPRPTAKPKPDPKDVFGI